MLNENLWRYEDQIQVSVVFDFSFIEFSGVKL